MVLGKVVFFAYRVAIFSNWLSVFNKLAKYFPLSRSIVSRYTRREVEALSYKYVMEAANRLAEDLSCQSPTLVNRGIIKADIIPIISNTTESSIKVNP